SLGAVLVLLAIAVWVHWRNTVQVDQTGEWVAHTREVLGEVEHVLRLNVDLETGLRGYIITGNEQLLEPLTKATRDLPPALVRLSDLTRDNPAEHERVAQLERLVAEHVEFRTRVVDMVRTQGYEATRQQLQPGEGIRRTDQIRAALAAIRAAEED